MPSPLETATVPLGRATVAHTGDTFTYTPAGGTPVTGVLGFIEYPEVIANPDPRAPGAIAQDLSVELDAEQFPTRPNAACRLTNIKGYPGTIFQPIAVRRSEFGDWAFELKKVPA